MSIPAGDRAKRIRLSPDDRRNQLLALGAKMLGERAIEEISISDIAAEAGISRGLLFHYFPTKKDFQLSVVGHANAELLARISPDRTLTVPEMVRDSIARYIDYVSENRSSYLALLRGPASVNPELGPLVDETRDAIIDLLVTELPAPVAAADRPRLLLGMRGWIAFAEETTLTWLRTEPIARDELLDLLAGSLLRLASALAPEVGAALRN